MVSDNCAFVYLFGTSIARRGGMRILKSG